MAPPLKKRLHRLKLQITQIILLSTLYSLLSTICYAQAPRFIRVAIIQDVESVSLKVSGPYEITDAASEKILSRGRDLKTTVTVYKEDILLGNINCHSDKVLLRLGEFGTVVVDGRKFRGDIQFIRQPSSSLSIINHVELEDYIKGILYHESSHYWPLEVLKAQAIVCRTYALYQIEENKAKDYDVTSDIYSQVYGGRTSERYRTNKIVDETKGIALTYQGKVFPTYYHATCGGSTEDASLLWNINLSPLKGVLCGFCKDSVHFNWHQVLAQNGVKDSLAKSDYKIKNIKDMLIVGRDKSGRITNLRILTDTKEIEISAKDFRNILGPNVIKSTNFKVSLVNHDLVFEGFGWGHGVGMCQWGGYFMAKQGYNAEEILKYYYPGASLFLLSP